MKSTSMTGFQGSGDAQSPTVDSGKLVNTSIALQSLANTLNGLLSRRAERLKPSAATRQIIDRTAERGRRAVLQATGWLDDPSQPNGGQPEQLNTASSFDGFLVTWNQEVNADQRLASLARLGLELVETIATPAIQQLGGGVVDWVRPLNGGSNFDSLQQIAAIEGVASVDPNWQLTTESSAHAVNDTLFGNASMWGLYGENSLPSNPFGSNASLAWELGFTGSSKVVIGIIDTGFDPFQADLWGNVGRNPGEIPGNGIDDDGNGYIDDIFGWDFVNNDSSIYDSGQDQHGTHVAGTIGAVGNNKLGVAGVAHDVSLLSAKFLGPNGGFLSDAIKAIDYFTDLKLRHGLNIVATNNSWGGGGYTQALADAIARAAAANIVFVAAAGNSATSLPSYPASYPLDNVISVAALTSAGQLASFSNFGTPHVDIGAPGQGILSTLPGMSYATMSGTSMAAPHVTGAIALLAAAFPQASARDLRTAVLTTAVETPSLQGKVVTGGRLDVVAALDWLSQRITGEPLLRLPNVAIESVSKSAREGDAQDLVFTLSRNDLISDPLSVRLGFTGTATAGTDYTSTGQVIAFQPGQTTAQLVISPIDDELVETTESIVVSVLPGKGYRPASASSAGAVLLDNDLPTATISVSPERLLENEVLTTVVNTSPTNLRINRRIAAQTPPPPTPKPMVFTVALDQPAPWTIQLGLTLEGSATLQSDYTIDATTVTIPAGATQATINVLPINDGLIELDESITLKLKTSTQVRLGAQHQATGWLVNDDRPEVNISLATTSVLEDSENALSFGVSFSQAALHDINVLLNISGSATPGDDLLTDEGANPGSAVSLLMPAGTTFGYYTLYPVADSLVEDDETVTVQVMTSSDYTLGTAVAVTGTILEPVVADPNPPGQPVQTEPEQPASPNPTAPSAPATPDPVNPGVPGSDAPNPGLDGISPEPIPSSPSSARIRLRSTSPAVPTPINGSQPPTSPVVTPPPSLFRPPTSRIPWLSARGVEPMDAITGLAVANTFRTTDQPPTEPLQPLSLPALSSTPDITSNGFSLQQSRQSSPAWQAAVPTASSSDDLWGSPPNREDFLAIALASNALA